MNKTQIDWCRNPDGTPGYTWNPITGCLNHVNGMCKGGNFPCYAYRLAHGRLKERYLYGGGEFSTSISDHDRYPGCVLDPFYPRFWPERLNIPEPPALRQFSKQIRFALQQNYRKGIFVCDMSDLFGIGVPDEWTQRVMSEVRMHPEHRFYLLTKQPQNLIKFSPFPDNCWVGVTATNTEMLLQACSALEYPVEARIKYLSIEPFLDWSFNWNESYLINAFKRAGIKWLIIGAQTKPTVYPKIESVREIVEAADQAGIPVFIKNNLALYARNISLYPSMKVGDEGYLDVRQEMPS